MKKILWHFLILQLFWLQPAVSMEEETWEEKSKKALKSIPTYYSQHFWISSNDFQGILINNTIVQIKHKAPEEAFGFFLKRDPKEKYYPSEWWVYQMAIKLDLKKSISKSFENPLKTRLGYETIEKPVHLFKKDDLQRISSNLLQCTDIESCLHDISKNNFLNLEILNNYKLNDRKNDTVIPYLDEESLQEATLSIIAFGLTDAVFRNSGLKYRNNKLQYVHFDTLASIGTYLKIPFGMCVPQILGLKFVEKPFSPEIIKKIIGWNLKNIMDIPEKNDLCFNQYNLRIKGWNDKILDKREYFPLLEFKTRLETLQKAALEAPKMAIGEILITYFNTLLCPDLKGLLKKGFINKEETVEFTHTSFSKKFTSEGYWKKLLEK